MRLQSIRNAATKVCIQLHHCTPIEPFAYLQVLVCLSANNTSHGASESLMCNRMLDLCIKEVAKGFRSLSMD